MSTDDFAAILTPATLRELFPAERANDFFDALFGDADEGAYDIELAYRSADAKRMVIDLLLHERPGRCLACNLTHGLPQVFSRHPIIDIAGLVTSIDSLLGSSVHCKDWSLGHTEQRTRSTHAIPLTITLDTEKIEA